MRSITTSPQIWAASVISGSHATITLNNTLINAHMIAAVSQSSVERFMLRQITAVYEAMLPRHHYAFC